MAGRFFWADVAGRLFNCSFPVRNLNAQSCLLMNKVVLNLFFKVIKKKIGFTADF
jgi:hypothetical protein